MVHYTVTDPSDVYQSGKTRRALQKGLEEANAKAPQSFFLLDMEPRKLGERIAAKEKADRTKLLKTRKNVLDQAANKNRKRVVPKKGAGRRHKSAPQTTRAIEHPKTPNASTWLPSESATPVELTLRSSPGTLPPFNVSPTGYGPAFCAMSPHTTTQPICNAGNAGLQESWLACGETDTASRHVNTYTAFGVDAAPPSVVNVAQPSSRMDPPDIDSTFAIRQERPLHHGWHASSLPNPGPFQAHDPSWSEDVVGIVFAHAVPSTLEPPYRADVLPCDGPCIDEVTPRETSHSWLGTATFLGTIYDEGPPNWLSGRARSIELSADSMLEHPLGQPAHSNFGDTGRNALGNPWRLETPYKTSEGTMSTTAFQSDLIGRADDRASPLQYGSVVGLGRSDHISTHCTAWLSRPWYPFPCEFYGVQGTPVRRGVTPQNRATAPPIPYSTPSLARVNTHLFRVCTGAEWQYQQAANALRSPPRSAAPDLSRRTSTRSSRRRGPYVPPVGQLGISGRSRL
ncbi:hypothetical protein BV20DRAFT_967528 [Pilatotrama ljubarskyi]|nr:hypothetical protein BV20DRAFT_967528 [Pilatotrama ljubarskyi]